MTTRMPHPALRAVARPLALGFHALAKGVYRPLGYSRARHPLPLDEDMMSVAGFSFRQNYGIVFDQLSAPTAAYVRGEELEGWFTEASLSDVRISHRHSNSWRGSGRALS